MTLHPPSRMSELRVIRKWWPIEASRGKLVNCELYTEDISIMNSGAEESPLLQDNREQGHGGLSLGPGTGTSLDKGCCQVPCGENKAGSNSLLRYMMYFSREIGNINIL